MINSVKLAAACLFMVIVIHAVIAYHTREKQKRRANRLKLSYHQAYTVKHS